MNNAPPTTVGNCETANAPASQLDEQWSESCAAMTVAHVTHIPGTGLEPTPNAIEVLIPGDRAVFEASFESLEGRRQTALVRGPYISIVPGNQLNSIRSQRYPEMILLALDEEFYQEKVRMVLGFEPPGIELHFAVIDPLIRELGNAIRSEYHLLHPPGSVYLESLASVIAIHLAATYGRNRPEEFDACAGLPQHKLNCVLAFIKEHIAEAVPVDELAATVHMSPCHFARMFKQAIGQPPHAYVTGRRVERAKELLRTTDLPLVDVAANAGFQTQAHFTGVFGKHAGVTPRIFRLNCRAGQPSR
jgi:AraC family transcriptional regulator